MVSDEHLQILGQGVDFWNRWRIENPDIQPQLGGATLNSAKLTGINLTKANLQGAHLDRAELNDARLYLADLCGAHLHGAELRNSDIGGATLTKADLSGADIRWANVSEANLNGANLRGAKLVGSNLSETNFEGADLTGCSVYAISAWNLRTDENTKQSNLIITKQDEYTVTVDNLEVAQFVYLLLNHKKLREVIGTITSKAVLLLGRFTAERKVILDALADELRRINFLPIIFDFEKSENRDYTETIRTLAGLSLFVIVDITDPKSVPQELMATIPDYQIPFVPILQQEDRQYSMFSDFKKYHWVLRPVIYGTKEELLANFKTVILERAWRKHLELQVEKNAEFSAMSIDEMINSQSLSRRGNSAGAA